MDTQTPLTPPPGMPQQPQFSQQAIPLPNATAVLVLGILSIVFTCCYGIVGLILGIIAIILASKDKKLYDLNPTDYTLGSFNNLKAGRVCAIIGLCLSALCIIFMIIYLIFVGSLLSSMPWDIKY